MQTLRHSLQRLSLLAGLMLAACAPATGNNTPTAGTPAATQPAGANSSAAVSLTGEVTVFAASSLTEAFNEIGRTLEQQYPGLKVTFNFAGSQALRTQIEQGARADVFASANQQQMDLAIEHKAVANGAASIFATNKLVVAVSRSSSAQITSLKDLAKPGIKLVLAQSDVPVGGYSRDALNKLSANPDFGADFGSRVLKNLVSEETNVRQVLAKVQIGEADAAIVYTTDITPQAAGSVKQLPIPDQYNVIASYPIAAVVGNKEPELAKAFIAFVRSPEGQAILLKYGFLPPS